MGGTPTERKRQISKPEGQLLRLWITGDKTFHNKYCQWERFSLRLTTGGVWEAPARTADTVWPFVGGVTGGGQCGRSH